MSDPATTPRAPAAATDFWFAQVDHRLSRIEETGVRIERQVTNISYIGIAILGIEALRVLILV